MDLTIVQRREPINGHPTASPPVSHTGQRPFPQIARNSARFQENRPKKSRVRCLTACDCRGLLSPRFAGQSFAFRRNGACCGDGAEDPRAGQSMPETREPVNRRRRRACDDLKRPGAASSLLPPPGSRPRGCGRSGSWARRQDRSAPARGLRTRSVSECLRGAC